MSKKPFIGGNFIAFLKNWKNQRSAMEWLARHTKPFLPSLLILLALDVVTSVVSVGMTLINRQIIDTATAGGDFKNSIIIYVAILLASLIVGALTGVLATVINERFAFGIRLRIYDSVMHTCWDHISKYHSGDIITRLSSDVDIVASGIAEIIPSIFSLGVSFVAAFVTLAYFDIGIALFALIMAPLTALIGIISGKLIGPLQKKIQESESAYKSFMQESIANLTVFKAFGAQTSAADRLSALRGERIKWVMKRQRVSAITSMLLSLAFQGGYITAFVYSTIQLSRKIITYGTMSVFITLVSQVQAPVMGLSRLVPRVVSIFTSASRIMEIDGMPTEDMTEPELGRAIGLGVENISFAYGSEEILKDASVRIEPGEFVAMMGSSGIGKTTFIRLAMAYLTPKNGKVELFDSDGAYGPITAGARKYMSYVPQGNTLISGRIIDNILLGAPDISEEEIWEILRVVAVDEFVRETPNGLYTVIGERGLGLSEGQAQRLAIARALVKKAPFLILDEATSALDEQTELAVLNHLHDHGEGITCLLITHRRSVLSFCDRCIRIEDKEITEESASAV